MRYISPNIMGDDFMMHLEQYERLLWIGMLVKSADDQGRLMRNLHLLKIDVFPLDDKITIKMIEKSLVKFEKLKRILVYQDPGYPTEKNRKIIQIIRWWKYQHGTNFMAQSMLLAPRGWEDCYRHNTKGNKIIQSKNWKDRQDANIEKTLRGLHKKPVSKKNGVSKDT